MKLQITIGKELYQVKVEKVGDGFEVVVNGKPFTVKAVSEGFSIGGRVHKVELLSQQAENVRANIDGKATEALILDIVKEPPRQVDESAPQKTATAPSPVRSAKTVVAPMPGKIVKVLVSVGQEIKVGDILLILEAMKMENEIRSPCAGKVRELFVGPGAGVAAEDPLVDLE